MRDSANVLNSLAGHSQDPNYKFERLYRLLFNENLYALAYQKLSQNAGNYTKGTDGQTIDGMSIKHIHSIIGQLKDESYRPCPARRIYIPKKNGKQRPLGIPAFKDKLVQEVVRMILESIYEGHFEDCSHGFRPHRGCHTAMASLQKGGTGARWFIEGDIKGFFDNINHDVLIGILAERINDERFLRLIRKFLKAGYMEQWEYKNSYIGTPQGGIISPILANIYLDKLDKFMRNYINVFNKGKARVRNPEYKRVANRKDKRVKKLKNETDEQKKEALRREIAILHREMQQLPATLDMDENFKRMRYVRYADDFIVTTKDKETIETVILPLIREFMAERGLMLSEEKTKITHISEGFDFLGFNIREYKSNGKLLTKPSKNAMKSFCDKVRTKIKSNKSAKASSLIRMLNHMIPGWANYYRYGASSKAFSRVDFEIYKTLWQWARRRHPKKGMHWIKDKYFKQLHGRDWCFAATTKNKKSGKESTLRLKRLADTPIQKYVRVRTNVNPYDPADAPYYARRKSKNTENQLREVDDLLRMIWIHQGMRCPICGEIIDDERRWTTIKETINGKPFKILIHSSCKPRKSNPNKISRK